MFELILIIIIIVIISIISMHRDKKSKLTLIENLNSIGYSISKNLDIPDINSDNCN